MNPLLTVAIINWNAEEYIVDCIQSVLDSDYPNTEILLIDNASTDSSMKKVRSAFPELKLGNVRIIENSHNNGCPYAENQAISLANGKYLTILCSDTKIKKNCLSELVKTMESDSSIGAVGAKVLQMRNPWILDTAGEYLTQYGLLIQRHAGQELDKGQFDYQTDIFAIKGTALTARTDVLRNIGGFPKDYFMFLEETDTCWRIWLSGYRIVFVPSAVIYHATSTSIDKHPRKEWLVKYYGTRNYIYTLIKNYGTYNALRIVPLNMLLWLGIAAYMACGGRIISAWYVVCGVFWNIFHLPRVLRSRYNSQIVRTYICNQRIFSRPKHKRLMIYDKDIMPKIMKKVSIIELACKALDW